MVKKGNITYTYDKDGNLLSETGGYRSAEYRYNGQNRMAYSDVRNRTNGAVSASEYAYDAFGRRTITQDTGRTAMRTLYDGFTFEVIRDSETFQYGGFTVRESPGIVAPSSPVQGVDDSSRFRLVTEGYSTWLPDGVPQGRANGEAAVPAERKYVGISATLYANGEAVAVNRYDTATFTGGTVYLGKDALGSVRGATNDYGLLEERYEYDAFGKPYKGDLNGGMNLGYTGKPYDTSTGMYNYGYRDYQPELARFTTVDPIRDGANWFAYVNNDPVNYIDLWGLSANDKNKNNVVTTSPQAQPTVYNAQYIISAPVWYYEETLKTTTTVYGPGGQPYTNTQNSTQIHYSGDIAVITQHRDDKITFLENNPNVVESPENPGTFSISAQDRYQSVDYTVTYGQVYQSELPANMPMPGSGQVITANKSATENGFRQ